MSSSLQTMFLMDWNGHCSLWKSSQFVRDAVRLGGSKKKKGEKRLGRRSREWGAARGVTGGRATRREGMRRGAERTRRLRRDGSGVETGGGKVCVHWCVKPAWHLQCVFECMRAWSQGGEGHGDWLDIPFTLKKHKHLWLEGQRECTARPPVTAMFHTVHK